MPKSEIELKMDFAAKRWSDRGYLLLAATLVFGILTFGFMKYHFDIAGWTFFGFTCITAVLLLGHYIDDETKDKKD